MEVRRRDSVLYCWESRPVSKDGMKGGHTPNRGLETPDSLRDAEGETDPEYEEGHALHTPDLLQDAQCETDPEFEEAQVDNQIARWRKRG